MDIEVIKRTVFCIDNMRRRGERESLCQPPSLSEAEEIITATGAFLFPGFFVSHKYVGQRGEELLKIISHKIEELCKKAFEYQESRGDKQDMGQREEITDSAYEGFSREIILSLPDVFSALSKDALAMYEGDPAATSVGEVILTYPGFFAIFVYRLAHLFYLREIPLIPRMMTEIAHRKTGIDIHPGAGIGEHFSIDHGTGVVIGETAVIGDRVKLYQGVTIGAKSFEIGQDGNPLKRKKRHPEIGSGCIIYAGATILGGDTKIGENSIVGGNVWLTHSIPAGSKIYYEGG